MKDWMFGAQLLGQVLPKANLSSFLIVSAASVLTSHNKAVFSITENWLRNSAESPHITKTNADSSGIDKIGVSATPPETPHASVRCTKRAIGLSSHNTEMGVKIPIATSAPNQA